MLLCFSMALFLDQPHCKSEFKLWIYTKYTKLKGCFLWPCVGNPMILVAEVGDKSLCLEPELFIVLSWCFRLYTLTLWTARNFGLRHVSLWHTIPKTFLCGLIFCCIPWWKSYSLIQRCSLLHAQAWSSTSYLPLRLYNGRFCRYPIKMWSLKGKRKPSWDQAQTYKKSCL